MTLSRDQIADAREWAKTRRTFDTEGLAQELRENGADSGAHKLAGALIDKWIKAGEVKTAGGSPARRAYRWLHAVAE